jgi:hypothetical protein
MAPLRKAFFLKNVISRSCVLPFVGPGLFLVAFVFSITPLHDNLRGAAVVCTEDNVQNTINSNFIIICMEKPS